jgi:hypothetical protein
VPAEGLPQWNRDFFADQNALDVFGLFDIALEGFGQSREESLGARHLRFLGIRVHGHEIAGEPR